MITLKHTKSKIAFEERNENLFDANFKKNYEKKI
jgi:hypothetical protein